MPGKMPILLCCWACYHVNEVHLQDDGFLYCPKCETPALFLTLEPQLQEIQMLGPCKQSKKKKQEQAATRLEIADLIALFNQQQAGTPEDPSEEPDYTPMIMVDAQGNPIDPDDLEEDEPESPFQDERSFRKVRLYRRPTSRYPLPKRRKR